VIDSCHITIQQASDTESGQDAELYIDEGRQVILARPSTLQNSEVDLEIPNSDPQVAQRWEDLFPVPAKRGAWRQNIFC